MRLEDKQNFLSLVRLGIGHRAKDFPHDVNWEEMMALADAQGLSAIVLDGLNAVPSDGIKTMPKPLRLSGQGKWCKWKSGVMPRAKRPLRWGSCSITMGLPPMC